MAVLGPWPHGNPMPLSAQERERLAEIEAGLRADPDFSLATAADAEPRRHRRRTVAAAVLLIGITMALAGAAMTPRSLVVGVILVLAGFIAVIAGAVTWFLPGRSRSS